MSSCAASCSTCCRRASSASATSDSLPTATALLCCRCACGYSADHSKTRLRRHRRLQIRLIHSGTVQSAVEPCTSSNGSPLRNSCFALHLYRTSTRHEPLSTPSVFARASARTQIPCLNQPNLLACQSIQPTHRTLSNHRASPSSLHAIEPGPTKPLPDPSAPAQTHSKYIGFHWGRLPSSRCIRSAPLRA
jgi:hypothetical protein